MWSGLVSRRVSWGRRVVFLAVAVVAALVVVAPVGASTGERDDPASGVEADFQGDSIDLSEDWGDAMACLIWDEAGVEECFRTEAEMDKRIAELERKMGVGSAKASQCSGSMRLYDGVGYSGQVLYIRNRLSWINLSPYGFSNKASSFKIGPCSSYLADYTWGDGSWYSTSATQAWDVASVMASGWSNRVSSIYIQ